MTWRCPHQKKSTTRTCKKRDCRGSYYSRVRYGKHEEEPGGFKTHGAALQEGNVRLATLILGLQPSASGIRREVVTVNMLMDAYENYLDDRVTIGTMAEETRRGYKDNIRVYIRPLLGDEPLDNLTFGRVREFHVACKKLRPSIKGRTQQRINAALSAAISFAQREREHEDWFPRNNPCKDQEFAPSTFKQAVWDVDQVRKFFEVAYHDEYFPVYVLCVLQGVRRGEAIGIYEEAIDWRTNVWYADQQVTVQSAGKEDTKTKELKTARKGVRAKTLALNPDAQRYIKKLIDRRRDLYSAAIREGRYFFRDSSGRSLLMVREDGTPFSPRNVSERFKSICSIAGLQDIRLQDLRGTHANLLQGEGASPRLIQEVLGHSDGSAVTNAHYLLGSIKDQHTYQAGLSQRLALPNLDGDDEPSNVISLRR